MDINVHLHNVLYKLILLNYKFDLNSLHKTNILFDIKQQRSKLEES